MKCQAGRRFMNGVDIAGVVTPVQRAKPMSMVSLHSRIANIHSKQPWFVLSAANHYDLVLSDEPAISHFYSFKTKPLSDTTFAVPDGCVDILFDLDSTNPGARVCGTTLEARRAGLKSDHHYFGVRFAPGVTPDFLCVSADDLVDQELDFMGVINGAESVFEQVVQEREFAGKVRVLEAFLRGKAARRVSRLTLSAVHEICEEKGHISLSELEERTGYCKRTLQRYFNSDLGMSPKAFSRIIRCQAAIYDINHQDNVTFSDLACDLGFSDQPHFLREFKKLVSVTPVEYRQQVKHVTYLQRIRYRRPIMAQ
jgi:AraC-like DNA-binding protein